MTDPKDPLIEQLFASMGTPPLPSALTRDTFLEGVYERAAKDAEVALAPVLKAGLTAVKSPDDVTWAETTPAQEHQMEQLAETLAEGAAAPAMLWTRVRADLRQHLADERTRSRFTTRRWVAGLAAAVLLSASIYGYLTSGPTFSAERGTSGDTQIVFQESSSLSFDDRLIGG